MIDGRNPVPFVTCASIVVLPAFGERIPGGKIYIMYAVAAANHTLVGSIRTNISSLVLLELSTRNDWSHSRFRGRTFSFSGICLFSFQFLFRFRCRCVALKCYQDPSGPFVCTSVFIVVFIEPPFFLFQVLVTAFHDHDGLSGFPPTMSCLPKCDCTILAQCRFCNHDVWECCCMRIPFNYLICEEMTL